jgi:Fe-Mn family superoxide dismutase
MFTEQPLSPLPFGKITTTTHDEHQKLYAGYVKNANTVLEKLAAYQGDEAKLYETGELYRRFAFEYNGMRNHEVYFALTGGTSTDAPTLTAAIEKQWGTLAAFKSLFISLATTRGIGWAMLSYDAKIDGLILHWVDEQHLGQLQGTTPIIALDMWEHAYVADYLPSGKKQYVQDFFDAMHWSVAEALYSAAKGTL